MQFELTKSLLTKVAALPARKRSQVLKIVGALEWQKCADDIFYWLDASRHDGIPYVYTNDPHPLHQCLLCQDDPNWKTLSYHFNKRIAHLEHHHKMHPQTEQEVKQFFRELDSTRPFTLLPYMPAIIENWLKYPLMVVEKSRDMMATWLTVTMYTWDTIFHKGRQNIFQSEDATKTWELIERAHFIWKNQPKWLREVHMAQCSKGSNKSGELKIPSLNSELLGFPAGADQIRQYHPSGFFSDEAAFQTAAGDSFGAIKPSIQNGGRYTAVSSANPSFFMHLVKDTIHTVQDFS